MNQLLTPKQRMLNAIQRKSEGRHPVQIDLTPLALDRLFSYLNQPRKGEEELLDFFDNSIVYAYLNDPFGKLRAGKVKENEMFDEWAIGWSGTSEGTFFTHHPLENMDNYKSYEFPDPNAPRLMDHAEDCVARYGDRYMVTSYQVICLFERAWALRGFENFLTDMIIDEDFAEELLEKITDYQVTVAQRYVKAGVACGRTGDDYGMQTGMLMRPEVWRKMIKPKIKRIWDVYHNAGLPVIHHSCGNVLEIIPDFIEMGLDVLNNCQFEAMAPESLSPFGEHLTFYGGLAAQSVLPCGTPEEVRQNVRRCIEVLGANNGYIVSPGIALTSDVPNENIEAMISAIKEFNVI